MKLILLALPVLLLLASACCAQQESGITDKVINLPSGFFNRINQKTASLDKDLTSQTDKYLARLAKKEERLRKKAFARDSVEAKKIFGNQPLDYSAMSARLQNAGAQAPKAGAAYSPYLDSLKTSLKFLQQKAQGSGQPAAYQAQLAGSLAQLNQLQSKMQVADQLKQQIRQHKDQLKAALSQATNISGLQNAYQGYNKQAYYYGQQVKAYRDELNDPDKLTKRALGLVEQLPSFQQFMKTNSELASLFSLPSAAADPAQNLSGLQTRSNIQSLLQAQVSAGGPNAQQLVQQNLQSAQAELKNLKDKVAKLGGGSSDLETPDFKPNGQHTKTFLKRLEYGANVQSTKSTYAFPTSTNIAVSVGYKLNDKSTIGLGAGYIIGWGRDIKHIVVSSNGASLRSFLDTKIKGSIYATGGYELNYQPVSPTLTIAGLNNWTKSGLVGITKKYTINAKVKGNMQLLWDFLSYGQLPRTTPIKFRVGYTF